MTLLKNLKALADEKRLKILQMLITCDLCVGALAKQLGISKPAVSQHLQILRKAGLVRGEKRGYWTHYVVERKALKRIALELNELAMEQKTDKTMCWRIEEGCKNESEAQGVDRCQNCCRQTDSIGVGPETTF